MAAAPQMQDPTAPSEGHPGETVGPRLGRARSVPEPWQTMPIEARHTEGAAADPCPLGAFCFLNARSIVPFIVVGRLSVAHLTVWMFQRKSIGRYVRTDW